MERISYPAGVAIVGVCAKVAVSGVNSIRGSYQLDTVSWQVPQISQGVLGGGDSFQSFLILPAYHLMFLTIVANPPPSPSGHPLLLEGQIGLMEIVSVRGWPWCFFLGAPGAVEIPRLACFKGVYPQRGD